MKIISCAKATELTCDFVAGALSPKKQRRVAAHLAGCDTCRAAVERFRDVRDLFTLSEPPRHAPIASVARIASAPSTVTAAPIAQRQKSSLPWLASLVFHGLMLTLAAVVSFSFSGGGSGNDMGLSDGAGIVTPEGHGAGSNLKPARFPTARPGEEYLNSAAIERSVRAALRYLARQQHHDGSWSAGLGSSAVHDTALAVLAATKAGRAYNSAFNSIDLAHGAAWLTLHHRESVDAADAALAALALTEFAQATDDANARNAAQECLRDFARIDTRDATARGWTILALKAAADAGLDAPQLQLAKSASPSQLTFSVDLLQYRLRSDGNHSALSSRFTRPIGARPSTTSRRTFSRSTVGTSARSVSAPPMASA